MIRKIRQSNTFKVTCVTVALTIFFEIVAPLQAFALTGGPSQPEFASFTPVGTSDMVDLSTGDMNYNIPLLDVGGYPVNISYSSSVGMDQEASWVGLGWNLSVGQINRNVRGLADDFQGDELIYENYLKPNVTAGASFKFTPAAVGFELDAAGHLVEGGEGEAGNFTIGVSAMYNNYRGFSIKPSVGVQMDLGKNASVGFNAESGPDGLSISPTFSLHAENKVKNDRNTKLTTSVGLPWNSRTGVSQMTIDVTRKKQAHIGEGEDKKIKTINQQNVGSSVSFAEQLYTPSRRVGMETGSFTVNAALGAEVFGGEGQGQITAYGTVMIVKPSEMTKTVKAYGYANTDLAGYDDALDFNREKDGAFSINTTNLPLTNYTYDTYSVQGHGVSGQFRPYRNQVGYVFDPRVNDGSTSGTFGFEVGTGNAVHAGLDFEVSMVSGKSGVWSENNYILSYLKENYNYDPDYEKVHYKNVGDLSIDRDFQGSGSQMFSQVGDYQPVRIPFVGEKFYRTVKSEIRKKITGTGAESGQPVSSPIKRTQRQARNQAINMLTKEDVSGGKGFGPLNYSSQYTLPAQAKNHHTAEIQVVRTDGARYIYGLPVYNTLKKEATFAVDGTPDCNKGVVNYNPASTANESGWKNLLPNDKYFNRVTTPAYVHTHLLTSVLSTDYQDLSGNGPTPDDFGSYTKFSYKTYGQVNQSAGVPNGSNIKNYKWRIPYAQNEATHNEGFKTDKKDDQGTYIYGEKEIYYLDKIETKTHIAVFHYSPRKDAKGVAGENGGMAANNNSYKLDKISLYSVGEYNAQNPQSSIPIKEVHFEYSYSLCPGVPNNIVNASGVTPIPGIDDQLSSNELSNHGGKLTLKKIYFTYRNSNMGKYSGYTFNYGEYTPVWDTGSGSYIHPDEYSGITLTAAHLNRIYDPNHAKKELTGRNPAYNIKGYDTWGNYLPNIGNCGNTDPLTAAEFPYTSQEQEIQDNRSAVWCLSRIGLPSGGIISVAYESDDYGYIQDKEPMRMFKVVGAGSSPIGSAADLDENTLSSELFKSPVVNKPKPYIYVQVDPGTVAADYLSTLKNNPIYFRFLMNMTQLGAIPGNEANAKYDYVSGYFEYEPQNNSEPYSGDAQIFTVNGQSGYFLSIPVKLVEQEGGIGGLVNKNVHPISKATWSFGRKYLNDHVYSAQPNGDSDDIEAIVTDLLSPSSLSSLLEIFSGPNGALEKKGVGRCFIKGKSWVRLMEPDGKKLGGGCRVKEIRISDVWEEMNNGASGYQTMHYGQRYEYVTTEGNTSGVATYEPIGNKENPFVQPVFYATKHLLAPNEENYVEKPFGESFFPNPQVTYSRVKVSNLAGGQPLASGHQVKKLHRTGSVVTEFYTSKDYPTIVDQTTLQSEEDKKELLDNILSLNVRKHFTASQGYVIHLNDMNGKQKAQWVYAEDQTAPISGIQYIYDNNSMISSYNASMGPDQNKGRLNNHVKVINPDGSIEMKTIGVEVDIVNDFRENETKTRIPGVNGNLATFLVAAFPALVPLPLPDYSQTEDRFRSVSTTKVINTFGILKETIAHDSGATVYTKNLAWDAETGEVLITETVDEYNDKYYTFNYPAHWYYNGMGQAARNLGFEGAISSVSGGVYTLNGISDVEDYLLEADELYLSATGQIAWVSNIDVANNQFTLIDALGNPVNGGAGAIEVTRSGRRNLQSAAVMNIILKHNPLKDLNGNDITALSSTSFVSQSWNDWYIINAGAVEYSDEWTVTCECAIPGLGEIYNPYRMNEKGIWRTRTSRTYLTGRNRHNDVTPRMQGFFTAFSPMYKVDSNGNWIQDLNDWTFVTSVTDYSPYGFELENRDALNRHSAAQYGYNNMFPMAVGANARYDEIGYDGFEDYTFDGCPHSAHFTFKNVINPLSEISTEAHTGKHSLRVKGSSRVTLSKKLNCEE